MKTDIKNKDDIIVLVDAFYLKVKSDSTIGYLFTEVAMVNWQKHLPIMYDFWDNILFHTGNFEGNPMLKHRMLDQKVDLQKLILNIGQSFGKKQSMICLKEKMLMR
ncbi:group III truncated hemoglobin [Flavobacterium ginsengisoli]|uniref:group III truncated hemoglobin n=1 Tax=Flavobacterium ginsengisoli TaxID=871694 RepID=UPI0024150440|nr:group III truncated hemoglobin [Flavobacterium ginsengisoli]